VTPLPCNSKHYFHSDCVVQWFEKQEEGQRSRCPICRAEFTREQMREYSTEIEKKLEERDSDNSRHEDWLTQLMLPRRLLALATEPNSLNPQHS
jgi:predicted nucleic acid-binding protein